jgi:subtilisin family serine protease
VLSFASVDSGRGEVAVEVRNNVGTADSARGPLTVKVDDNRQLVVNRIRRLDLDGDGDKDDFLLKLSRDQFRGLLGLVQVHVVSGAGDLGSDTVAIAARGQRGAGAGRGSALQSLADANAVGTTTVDVTPGDPAVPGQYIVVFKDSVRRQDAPGLARRLAAQQNTTPLFTYQNSITGFAARMSENAAKALAHNPNVAYVEQDQILQIDTTQTNATWGLDRIDQRSRLLDATFSYTETGAGVKAYIIDTGIRFSHDEFGGRAISGKNVINSNLPATDDNGHGTHVAGTVGGATYGVAKGVTLVGVKVLNASGSGTVSQVIAGIDWVTADHQPGQLAVANMSLGGSPSTALDDAVRKSIDDGVSYAVAAGNGNIAGIAQDASRSSPARVAEAMTIGATDQTDKKASWSNYGDLVDWFAPGVSITSAWYTSDTATNTISGTSMATPHTTGVAALYLQDHPSAAPPQVRDALYALTTQGIVTSSRSTNNNLLFTNY